MIRDSFLGIDIENIPARCHDCPVLARCALELSGLDLTELDMPYPAPSTAAHEAKRIAVGLGNNCLEGVHENGECGSRLERFMLRALESAKRVRAERGAM